MVGHGAFSAGQDVQLLRPTHTSGDGGRKWGLYMIQHPPLRTDLMPQQTAASTITQLNASYDI